MRIELSDAIYASLIPLMELVEEQEEKIIMPYTAEGPYLCTKCTLLPPEQWQVEYTRCLGYWKLNSAQNKAIFAQMWYTVDTKESVELLSKKLRERYAALEIYGGTLNIRYYSPSEIKDSTGIRCGIKVEYSTSLYLVQYDFIIFETSLRYPSIYYIDLALKIELARTKPVQDLPEELALELVTRAAGVYTNKKYKERYKDTLVTIEELHYFTSPDLPLSTKQEIIYKACNRLEWFITSDEREQKNQTKFNSMCKNKLCFSDPDHDKFSGLPSMVPDFYIDGHKEIGVEHKTVDTITTLKKKFNINKNYKIDAFDEDLDLLSKIEYLKKAPAINTKKLNETDDTRYHGAKVCLVEVRESGECFWIYTLENGEFCVRFLYNINE